MAQKINANALRIGINRGWKSVWYAEGSTYTDQLHEDLAIKEIIRKKLQPAGIDKIEIRRSAGKLEVNSYVARPGVAIGRGGTGIEELNKALVNITSSNIEVKINEVGKPDLSARILAEEIRSGLIRRMPPKLLAQNVTQKAMAAGAHGIRVWVAGRIGGAQQARRIKFSEGAVPLHTLKANIDYASEVAETNEYGKFGIKVWVYSPDVLNNDKK
jgi:small subunit ribosomal protein S3